MREREKEVEKRDGQAKILNRELLSEGSPICNCKEVGNTILKS